MAYINGKEILFGAQITTTPVNIVQETGDSENAVMSQKATTEAIAEKGEEIRSYVDTATAPIAENSAQLSAMQSEGLSVRKDNFTAIVKANFVNVKLENSTGLRGTTIGHRGLTYSVREGDSSAPTNAIVLQPPTPTAYRKGIENIITDVDLKDLKLDGMDKRVSNLESTLLTFIEDNSIAYEKDVPVGVGENAVLSSIGKTEKSTNVLDPSLFVKLNSGVFSLNEDGGLHIRHTGIGLIEYTASFILEAGTYTVAETELLNDSGYLGMTWFGDGSQTITLEETATVDIKIVCIDPFECDTRIWINKGEKALPYEPYDVATPVTAVESYGSNLLDASLFGFPVNADGSFRYTMDYGEGSGGHWITATVSLSPGTYYLSYSERGLVGSHDFEGSGFYIDGELFDTVTLTEQTDCEVALVSGGVGYCSADLYVMLTTDPDAEFEPYSAEPIDTFTIPPEIQALNGYGKDGFLLDFESKTATYEGKVTDVSAYLTGYTEFKTIAVQGGGKVRFVSESKLPVPSNMTYVKAKE